jgi:hypothetical protein
LATLSLSIIMGVIGAIVALFIGIVVMSGVTDAINCDEIVYEATKQACESATSTAWIVIAILPIALFFVMFQIFGGLGNDDDDLDEHRAKMQTIRTETKKQRQKRKQADVDMQLEQYDNKEVHSFLTNWFRGKKNQ